MFLNVLTTILSISDCFYKAYSIKSIHLLNIYYTCQLTGNPHLFLKLIFPISYGSPLQWGKINSFYLQHMWMNIPQFLFLFAFQYLASCKNLATLKSVIFHFIRCPIIISLNFISEGRIPNIISVLPPVICLFIFLEHGQNV